MMRYFHKKHKTAAETTSWRIQWWSILESIVLVLMTAGQIYYVQKMVNAKLAQRV